MCVTLFDGARSGSVLDDVSPADILVGAEPLHDLVGRRGAVQVELLPGAVRDDGHLDRSAFACELHGEALRTDAGHDETIPDAHLAVPLPHSFDDRTRTVHHARVGRGESFT